MKKKLVPFIMIIALALSACTSDDIINAAQGITDAKKAAENAAKEAARNSEPGQIGVLEEQMMQLLEKGDREGFKALFSEDIRESEGFEESFNAFFDETVKFDPRFGEMELWYAKYDKNVRPYEVKNGLVKTTIDKVNLNYEIDRTDVWEESFWTFRYESQRDDPDPRRVGIRGLSAELLNVKTFIIGEVSE